MTTAKPPVVVVTGRYRPHELLFLIISVVFGAGYVAGLPRPPSTILLPGLVFPVWSWTLLISGTVGLVGCLWRGNKDLGLELERGALILQASAIVLYTTVVFAYNGLGALLTGGITLAWGAANLWRAVQITNDLRRVDQARQS